VLVYPAGVALLPSSIVMRLAICAFYPGSPLVTSCSTFVPRFQKEAAKKKPAAPTKSSAPKVFKQKMRASGLGKQPKTRVQGIGDTSAWLRTAYFVLIRHIYVSILRSSSSFTLSPLRRCHSCSCYCSPVVSAPAVMSLLPPPCLYVGAPCGHPKYPLGLLKRSPN